MNKCKGRRQANGEYQAVRKHYFHRGNVLHSEYLKGKPSLSTLVVKKNSLSRLSLGE
jgi:hypothetical protein